jgi:hypothetical protein
MDSEVAQLENQVEMGHKARKETEDFLNQWISDNTKGWPVQSRPIEGSENHSSTPLVMCLN